MVTVTTDTLATEHRGESTALSDHLLGNAHFVLGLGLSDDEFANLVEQISIYKQSLMDEHDRYSPESQYQ